MSLLRQDATTGGWVIVAPGRRDRPDEGEPRTEPAPSPSAECPLCPGHEAETPPELWRIPAADGVSWAVRVVPNKFAVLSPEGRSGGDREAAPPFHEIDGIGHHELVVESPHHHRRLAEMSPGEVARVLETYHARYQALRRDPRVAYVVAFKNQGARAGASLAHPHSQIVATPLAPLSLEHRFARARAHHAETGRCLYRELVEAEAAAGDRVVADTGDFLVFCPFASGVPYETWIAPRRDQPSFGHTSASERAELGRVLSSTLGALDDALGAPDFNLILHTAPLAEQDEPCYLWHLQVLPRTTTLAGFELGTGIPINTCFPEDAAARLREDAPPSEPPTRTRTTERGGEA